MKVWPTSDAMRKVLRHPHNNVAFRDEGPMEWPDDSFTHRRLTDGDIVLHDPSPQPQAGPLGPFDDPDMGPKGAEGAGGPPDVAIRAQLLPRSRKSTK